MNAVLNRIQNFGIVPVIQIDEEKDALPLAKALCDGGLPCAEVTFRTAAAQGVIKAMTQAYPQMLVGAGTILTTTQVEEAIEAGASFIVSPGFNPLVVDYCVKKAIPIIPGCSSPSDIEQALSFGLEVVKFFPAEAAGGISLLKAMSAPYGNVKFMPTGGINTQNLKEYLDFKKVIACGASWMVSSDLINAGNFHNIQKLTREAVELMLGFELAHIGINASNENEAVKEASKFNIFGFTAREESRSIFASTGIEVMKQPYLGKYGHIAMKTNDIDRAVSYLECQGVEFYPDTARYDGKGNLETIYLKEEIGGFAVHLVQKK